MNNITIKLASQQREFVFDNSEMVRDWSASFSTLEKEIDLVSNKLHAIDALDSINQELSGLPGVQGTVAAIATRQITIEEAAVHRLCERATALNTLWGKDFFPVVLKGQLRSLLDCFNDISRQDDNVDFGVGMVEEEGWWLYDSTCG